MISTVAIIVVVLATAWGADRWRIRHIWGKKSAEELAAIIHSAEWRRWELALKEMKRRGNDVSGAVGAVGGRLLSESKWERAAARIVLMKVHPETRPFLKGYRPGNDEPTRRKALESFFATYKVNSSEGAV